MTRQEMEAWGLVGAGGVIIILLLLDYAPITAPGQNVSITEGAAPPADQYTFNILPPKHQPLPPWQILFPPLKPPEFNILISNPCTCSCTELSEQQGKQFAAQVDALNQMLKDGAVANAASYFSTIPYGDLFATNATGIAAFTSGVGLPNPIEAQNVTVPGETDLVGGGSLSYTFQGAPVG